MSYDAVPSLVLRPPRGAHVAHLVLRVEPGQGGEALRRLAGLLRDELPPSFGLDAPADDRLQCSVGFTWRGLQSLCVPAPYLRVFHRLSPAFAQGAPLRAAQLGDGAFNAPQYWDDGFRLDAAHLLLTLHGMQPTLDDFVASLTARWWPRPPKRVPAAVTCVAKICGARLGAPAGQEGEWVHFGYRDGLSDRRIVGLPRPPAPVVSVEHAAGEFLLGHADDRAVNAYALPSAPDKVRDFFRDGSFAALRPMRQDVAQFESAVQRWCEQARGEVDPRVGTDWIKAKLCGRWPTGQALVADRWEAGPDHGTIDFTADPHGFACPFASHIRRMNPRGEASDAHQRQRPLLRRGTPFGSAVWNDPTPDVARGLIGLFFCASLADQFEHLLGQWANRRPLGAPDTGQAQDAFAGVHEDPTVAMRLPRAGAAALELQGFMPWTRTLGTMYAWHPSRSALDRIVDQDWVPPESQGPWL